MKKRTLWYILTFILACGTIGCLFSDSPIGDKIGETAVGLILTAALAVLAAKTDPEARFTRKQKIQVPDDYTAVDIETTGLDTATSRIVELGAVRVRKGKPVATFSQLVNPGMPIPAKTTQITGIDDDAVKAAPDSKTAMREFLAFIGRDMLIGHNIDSFDMPIIRNEAKRDGLTPPNNPTVDTLPIARQMWPGERNRLVDLIRRLGIAQTEEHRAESDAMQTVQVFEAMKQL